MKASLPAVLCLAICLQAFWPAHGAVVYLSGSGYIRYHLQRPLAPDHLVANFKQTLRATKDGYDVRIYTTCDFPPALEQPFTFPTTGGVDTDISALARDITSHSRTRAQAITRLVLWLRLNVDYSFARATTTPKPLPALLRTKEGTCVDFAFALGQLLDACGFDNRTIRGLLVTAHGQVRFHRWLEVRAGTAWVPLDPLSSLFFVLPNHIVLRVDSRLSSARSPIPAATFNSQLTMRDKHYAYLPQDALENAVALYALKSNAQRLSAGIVVPDPELCFKRLVVTAPGYTRAVTRDLLPVFFLFGLPPGDYQATLYYNGQSRITWPVRITGKELVRLEP